MSIEEKEITLYHNEYEIKLKIKKDFEETKKAIKEKLYFQDKDLNKFELFYLDEDEDENNIEEDTFEDAFNSNKWGLRSNEVDNINPEENDKLKIDLEDVKEKIKNKVNKTQKEINEKVKAIKDELISKFTKLANNKISENNKKYEKKIQNLEKIIKSLKDKNKTIIEEIEKEHESSIKTSLEQLTNYAESKIQEQMEQYNNEFVDTLDSKITDSTVKLKEVNNEVKNKINELNEDQEKMKNTMDTIKNNVSEIFNKSQILNKKSN